MSYATAKGYSGEKDVEDFLNGVFNSFGYTWMRVGGTERNKRVFAGDVVLNPRLSRNKDNCVLEPYYIEVKKKGSINFWADSDKARDDAKWWNKRGYILFAHLSKKGEAGAQGKKLVVMDWSVLSSLLTELQGYKNDEQSIKN